MQIDFRPSHSEIWVSFDEALLVSLGLWNVCHSLRLRGGQDSDDHKDRQMLSTYGVPMDTSTTVGGLNLVPLVSMDPRRVLKGLGRAHLGHDCSEFKNVFKTIGCQRHHSISRQLGRQVEDLW